MITLYGYILFLHAKRLLATRASLHASMHSFLGPSGVGLYCVDRAITIRKRLAGIQDAELHDSESHGHIARPFRSQPLIGVN